jgi:hypothetical protein
MFLAIWRGCFGVPDVCRTDARSKDVVVAGRPRQWQDGSIAQAAGEFADADQFPLHDSPPSARSTASGLRVPVSRCSISSSGTLGMVGTCEPVPPGQLAARAPRDLETICLKCLQKDAVRRYPSAVALADDLERNCASKPIPAGRCQRGEGVAVGAACRSPAGRFAPDCGKRREQVEGADCRPRSCTPHTRLTADQRARFRRM